MSEQLDSFDSMQEVSPPVVLDPRGLELDKLEESAQAAAEALHNSHRENRELKRKLDDANKEKRELLTTIETLKSDLAEARTQRRDLAREEEIRRKVSGLLEKIESLETES